MKPKPWESAPWPGFRYVDVRLWPEAYTRLLRDWLRISHSVQIRLCLEEGFNIGIRQLMLTRIRLPCGSELFTYDEEG